MALPLPRTRKALSLLGLLALHAGKSLDRVYIAGTLWPDSTADDGATNLRQTLAILRRALGAAAEHIQTTPRPYLCLDLEGADCDLPAFLAAVQRWEKTQDSTAAGAAIDRYRGPFLEGIGDAWIEPHRAFLADRYITLLEALAVQAMNTGQTARAVELADRAARAEPLRESSQRILYTALARHGDLSAARRRFREYRFQLHRDLHLAPAPETVSLMERLVLEATPRPAPVSSPPTLPVFLTPFIGRESEIVGLCDRFAEPHTRLVTLLGPGGIGKTRLSVETASALAVSPRHGLPTTVFVDLSPLPGESATILSRIWQAIADALNLPASGLAPQEAVCTALQAGPFLLVLDNAEHIVAPVAAVTGALLRRCAGLRLLVTSREPLDIPGETRWRVEPLGETDAVQMFLQRASAALASRHLSPATAQRLCQQLDCLPLALELAAGRVGTFTLEEIERHLSDRFRLLHSRSRHVPERHRTLLATIDWSWDLLTASERHEMVGLSVFAGGCGGSLEAAHAVAFRESEDTWDARTRLDALFDKSLVQVHDGRFVLLESLRLYVVARAAPEELAAARERFRLYFTEYLMECPGEGEADWLGRLDRERDNLRLAMDYAPAEDALYMAAELGEWYVVRGYAEEGAARYADLLSRTASDHSARAEALYEAGRLAQARDLLEEAEALLQESRVLCEQRDDRASLWVRVLGNLGLNARNRNRLDEARELFDRALEHCRTLPQSRSLGTLLVRRALVEQDSGDPDAARRWLLEAAAVSAHPSRETTRGVALTILGFVEQERGNHAAAADSLTEALAIHHATGYRAEIARTALALGNSLHALGDTESAREFWQEARETYGLLHDREGAIRAELALEALADDGSFRRA